MIRAFATRTLLVIALATLSCCGSTEPKPEPFVFEPGAKVRNVRPNLPNQKAERYFQISHVYVLASSDLTEAWSMLSTTGLQANQLEVWRGNGLRAATADAAVLSQFFTKLPGYGGTKHVRLAAGRDPAAIETTPPFEQAIIVRGLLGLDRDETLKLPAGRSQFLALLEPGKEKAALEILPHHHWESVSVTPRTPQEKALDGQVFRELLLNVELDSQQHLVIGYVPPPKPEPSGEVVKGPAEEVGLPRTFVRPELEGPVDSVKDKDKDKAPPPTPTRSQAPLPVTTIRTVQASPLLRGDDAADIERPAGAQPLPAKPEKPAPGLPRLGDLLLTGERGGKRLQIICIIRIPTQGEALEAGGVVRPEYHTPGPLPPP